MSPPVELPCGDSTLTFSFPEGWRVDRAAPTAGPGNAEVADLARDALRRPLESPRLRDLARPGSRVTIAVTDSTRPCPDSILVPLLLEELDRAGVRRRDVTLLVALGTHRHTTPEERRRMFGDLGEVGTEDAQALEVHLYRELPALREADLPVPVPVWLHRRVTECDLLLSTGVVEPHQYAGFSGGRKTVAIGCAGAPTIRTLHGVPFLEAQGTRLGKLTGNPVHLALERIARKSGLAFVLNLALDARGAPIAAAAGSPGPVLERLVRDLAPFTRARAPSSEYDVVLAGVGAPKDVNLYQASRALTYLAFAQAPVVRRGGWILIAARCPEGVGEGPGEREFREGMQSGNRPDRVVAQLRARGFGAGGQRAFMVAKALERYRGGVVGALDPRAVRDCHLESFDTPEAAVRRLVEEAGGAARALLVPYGLSTLVTPGNEA